MLASNENEIGNFTQSFDPLVLHRIIHDINISVSPSDSQTAVSPLRIDDKLVAPVTHEIGFLESPRQYCSDYVSSLGTTESALYHSAFIPLQHSAFVGIANGDEMLVVIDS